MHDRSDVTADFTFDWQYLDEPEDGQRIMNYWDLEPLCRGPQPTPDWLVVDRAALDTELGVLKTGKEAEVHLLERATAHESVVLAAKRYRSEDHRTFHRSNTYAEGRRVRDSRITRAIAKGSSFGREAASGQWANAEWEALKRCWSAGVPVPYPVQIDGTEILMELVTDDEGPAPRLTRARPDRRRLEVWFEQVRDAMVTLATMGLVHGDLSPYNTLVTGDRLVIIDLPQLVDLIANPQAADFLMRDCHNMCTWFVQRGLEVDEHALFADLLATAYGG